jgi:aminobenzoyl-glutamate utilization protein B
MAATAVELFLNPALVEAAKADLQGRLDGNPFINPIPDDVMPPIPAQAHD